MSMLRKWYQQRWRSNGIAARLTEHFNAKNYKRRSHFVRGSLRSVPAINRIPIGNTITFSSLNFHDKWTITLACLACITFAATERTSDCKEIEDLQNGYTENPIQNIYALLQLYDDIDKNMEVLAGRMLEDLEKKMQEEKNLPESAIRLSPEQRALNMSIEFESTLEKVQNAVFRNHYITKEQVQEAINKLIRGELAGSGPNGQITVHEAEALEAYVKKLGRLRWKCTGSREPIISTHSKSLLDNVKSNIELNVIVQIMEALIPAMTKEMEKLVIAKRKGSNNDISPEDWQNISKEYIEKSIETTQHICQQYNVNVEEFQSALVASHDNPDIEKALADLSSAQKKRFKELGLF